MVTYEQARSDHEYLWKTYGPAQDMTGAYVDQTDLWRLLKSPTKATARNCYVDQIHFWFENGCDCGCTPTNAEDLMDDVMVAEIAARYSIDV